jgi:hypothetical protein
MDDIVQDDASGTKVNDPFAVQKRSDDDTFSN